MTEISVIKIGGATLGSHDTIIEDIVELQRQGKSLVIVHGGAKVVTEWLEWQQVPTRFVHGERVTDAAGLEMVTAVLGGLVNKELVAAINSRGGQAVGITGIDGNLLQGEIRDKEMGYVARIVKVNTAVLEALVGAGCVPLVAPLSMHAVGRADEGPLMLNVNGDTVAGELAAALGAEKLVFLTDVAGIRDRSGEMISELSAHDAGALLKSGTVSGGMIPKVRACLRALERAGEARIIDGREPRALLTEMAGRASGTTIKKKI